MKPIKNVRFVDYDPTFVPERSPLYGMLSEFYDLRIVKRPDYLISGGIGYHHLKYDCIKILSNEENRVADFNVFDYAWGSDELTFGDRYVRLPLYGTYDSYLSLYDRKLPCDADLLNRKFCSFVVSSSIGDPIRKKFFERLSKYKKVDSGGLWMNNVGGPVKSKLEFCRNYKFNIAFENSVSPGYVTEKLIEPLAVNSVTIYFGHPSVTNDFRAECMVFVCNEDDVERAVEEIIRLDKDDAAYLAKCKAPCVVHPERDYFVRKKIDFLRYIFDQPLDRARRLNDFGYQAVQRKYTKYTMLLHQFALDSYWFCNDLIKYGKIRHVLR